MRKFEMEGCENAELRAFVAGCNGNLKRMIDLQRKHCLFFKLSSLQICLLQETGNLVFGAIS